MTTILIYLAIMGTLAIIGFIVIWLIDRWINKMTKRMGLWGTFIATVTMFVVGAMLFPTLLAVALTVSGTTLAMIFSFPLLFGLPGWTILPYGALIGMLVYVAITWANKHKAATIKIPDQV